MLEENR